MSEEYCIIESENVKTSTDDNVINLVLQTLEMQKQVLVFNNSKRSSEATAEKVAKALPPQNKEALKELSKKVLKSLGSPTKQCRRLAMCVEKGVAFHHAGLVAKQRSLIEKNFKEGLIKVISSTPTLAAGLNLPAYKVIIKDYKRYTQRGFADIPILEFHQMSGRAGRPGKEDIGKAVLCVKTDDEIDRVVPKYVFGESEEIISKLAVEPTLKMYTLSLIAMDMINTKEEIKNFFENTLYAHQYEDLKGLTENVFRIIEILKDYKFISQDDDYYVATPMGKKISELYLNPDTANYFIENFPKFIKKYQKGTVTKYDIYSLINFIANTLEMRPLFRVLKAEEQKYIQKADDISDGLIVEFDPFEIDYEQYLSSLKTTDILIDWIYEAHEDYISDTYKITPGELSYKSDVVDWLLYCLEEIAYLKKEVYIKNFISKLRTRFKYGVKHELLPLINLKGVGRVRARKLFNAGLKQLSDLKKAPLDAISRAVGTSIAVKIKEQVSDDASVQDESLSKTIELKKPKEIRVREVIEVSDEEVDILLTNYQEYEKEKKEKNLSLTSFF